MQTWNGLLGPAPARDKDYCIGSNFWKFYLIRTNFTLGEPVSLVKVFLDGLDWNGSFWCSECGHNIDPTIPLESFLYILLI
jgi:hypothetical protein